MQGATMSHREIGFRCPRCSGVWQARIVNEDAVNLPLAAPAMQEA